MEILRTKRIIIRLVNLDDASFLKELVNSPGWLKYIGDRNVKTKEQADAYAKSYVTDYEKNGFGFYLLENIETGKKMGISGFIKRPELAEIDFGFAILPQYANQGYTYEASVPILEYGQNKFNFNTVLAITTEDNIPSQNLLTKLGLIPNGKMDFKGETLLVYKIDF